MCSEKQRELYVQFEPDANEVLFGQKTAPDRTLTQQELSQRKRIILKLVDQKLKLELIELMRSQQEQTLAASNANSTLTSYAANSETVHDWIMPSNYCDSIDQQNSDGSTKSHIFSDSCVNFPLSKHQSNKIGAQLSRIDRQQPNRYLTEQNTQKKSTSTNPSTAVTSKELCIPAKVALTKSLPSNMLKVSSVRSRASTFPKPSSTLCNQRTPPKTSDPSTNSKNKKNQFSVPALVELQTTSIRSEPKTIRDKRGATLIEAIALPSREKIKRKPGHIFNENFTKKMLLMNEKAVKCTTGKSPLTSRYTDAVNVALDTPNTQNVIDDLNNDFIGEGHIVETVNQSTSTEWTAMDQWVTCLFRNRSNNWAPLTVSDVQLKNEILMQMSVNPEAIRSHRSASTLKKRVGDKKFDELINVCKMILMNVGRTDPKKQANLSELQKKLAEDLKEWNCRRESATETVQYRGIHSKIASILSPFIGPGKILNQLINVLIRNPHLLLCNEIVKNRVIAKGQLVNDIMKSIKTTLDEFIPARLPKNVNIPAHFFFDVPFVVNLFNLTSKMTAESATELANLLLNSINYMQISIAFEWLENTLSNHLGVNVRPVKKPISYNQLKTICLKFHAPQHLHFNYLMEELRVYNPGLLTRRWEQRSLTPNNSVDSSKCMFVGVDVESLIALEDMNRTGTLRDTSVYFEITYDDNEENFEKMNFVKEKKRTVN